MTRKVNKDQASDKGQVENIVSCESEGSADKCFICGDDITKVALVKLIYNFEECYCNAEVFNHLVKRASHKDCYHKKYLSN